MKTVRLPIVLLLWLMTAFVACRPVPETNVLEPIKTEPIIFTPIASTETITLAPSPTATFTQEPNNCVADNGLPNPDIPENYIGWKPGVDFSELYNKENGDGNYMYWESLLNGDINFSVAGYKRGDNSYMFFVEKIVCRDANNDRIYEVIEAVRTRQLSEDEDIAPLNFECYRFGTDGIEEGVFAIVNETSGEAVFAWSIDVENKDIQETSLEGIKCSPSGIVAPSQ